MSTITVSAPARLGGFQAVVQDGAGVGACLLPDHGAARPLAPDDELLGRRRAKGVGGAEQHAAAFRRQTSGQLPDGGGLPHAVHADHQDHLRPGPAPARKDGSVGLLQNPEHPSRDQVLDRVRVGQLVPRQAGADFLDDFRGGADSDIGADQRHLEILDELRIDLATALEYLADLAGQGFPRLRDSLAEAAEQPRLRGRSVEQGLHRQCDGRAPAYR